MTTSSVSNRRFHHARVATLQSALEVRRCLRVMEVSSPLAALVVEACRADDENGRRLEYDGFWSSSLTDSTSRGKPDIEVLDVRSRLENIQEIFEITSKPLIIDADTGGKPEHLELNIVALENAGVSAAIIEDKTGLKKNSLLGTSTHQIQDNSIDFAHKIERACRARASGNFMVIARIESLILNKGFPDALARAYEYVAAGADGIMIHSKSSEPTEVLEFAAQFRKDNSKVPLVCAPTTYNKVKFQDLELAGFNIVIYANHLLRAAYPAMVKAAAGILKGGRSYEVEEQLLPIEEVLRLIPGTA